MRNQLILAAAAVPSLRVADVEYNTEQIIRLIAENPSELQMWNITRSRLFV